MKTKTSYTAFSAQKISHKFCKVKNFLQNLYKTCCEINTINIIYTRMSQIKNIQRKTMTVII